MTLAIRGLERAGIESARLEAQLLLAMALNTTRTAILAGTYPTPTDEQREKFAHLVGERVKRVPLAYLRGTQEFYGLEFRVSPAVLIPRPETELLVEFALERLPENEPSIFADVGTGSGCIAVSILKQRPKARAIATDLSSEALAVAQQNAAKHNVVDRMRLVQTDALTGSIGPLDLIVSNPPYIAEAEMAGLSREVREHDPPAALVGGADGLDAYRMIAAGAAGHLADAGAVAVEIGYRQRREVSAIFESHGFTLVEAACDLGGHDRALLFRTVDCGGKAHK